MSENKRLIIVTPGDSYDGQLSIFGEKQMKLAADHIREFTGPHSQISPLWLDSISGQSAQSLRRHLGSIRSDWVLANSNLKEILSFASRRKQNFGTLVVVSCIEGVRLPPGTPIVTDWR